MYFAYPQLMIGYLYSPDIIFQISKLHIKTSMNEALLMPWKIS